MTGQREKKSLEASRAEQLKLRNELEIILRDLKEKEALADEQLEFLRDDVRKNEKDIGDVEADLQTVAVPKAEASKAAFDKLTQQLSEREATMQQLKMKVLTVKNKESRFKNQEERDAFLKKELKVLKKQKQKQQAVAQEITEELATTEKDSAQFVEDICSLQETKRQKALEAEELEAQVKKQTKEMKSVVNARKEVWRKIQEHENEEDFLKQKLKDLDRKLKHSVGVSTFTIHSQVMELAKELRLEKSVYGPLYQLITAKDMNTSHIESDNKSLIIAMELSAGNQLNHIICDNESTCVTLIKEMTKRGIGR